jgi:hypothetical protein
MTSRPRNSRAFRWIVFLAVLCLSQAAGTALQAGIPGGTISGTAYDDLDKDGTRDPGEPGLAGITIQLDQNADNTVDDTRITGALGDYSFPAFNELYRLRMVVPAGRVQTSANPADILFTQGNVTGIDFGSALAASVVEVPALGGAGLAALAALLLIAALALLRGGGR